MAANHSFKEYVTKRFENDFWKVAGDFLENNRVSLADKFYKLHKVGTIEISDVSIDHVWVFDCPEMQLQFDVLIGVGLQATEGDYHYDGFEDESICLMIRCRGDLACNLEDFEIFEVTEYTCRSKSQNPLDDSLVPYITNDQMEDEANEFLEKYYPEALKITPRGEPPVWVDPSVLTERLELTIRQRRIKEDSSVFGQLYFEETDAELYDADVDCEKTTRVEGQTVLVDPTMFSFRNLGSANNTIVHECVHWVKHRKAFYLEKLFRTDISYISCEVRGGVQVGMSNDSAKFMEYQANQLTPRIQMPAKPFRAKANEYIAKCMREVNTRHAIDVMEPVISKLETEFCVSRQAAKIRLIQLGFEEAIGTYTYVDGHYVKPHSFKKGSIKLNQTFTISAQDAAVERFVNPELQEIMKDGDYLFVDNHYVYYAPLYVQTGEKGKLELTDYARTHMDECCLVFDMSVKTKMSADYHTVCYLNREPSDITFEVKYHNGYQNAPQERQIAMRKKQMEEWINIRDQMTDNQAQCMELLLDWRGIKYTELADAIDINERTVRRIVNGETDPKLETAVLICFALNLHPMISEKLLTVLGCRLKPNKLEHQWINEALHVKYPEPVDAVREYLGELGVKL